MKYMGSKRRIAHKLKPILELHRKKGQTYVEPFIGGANMFECVDNPRIGADLNPYVIKALTAIRDEPQNVPKNNTEYTKEMHDYNRKHLNGLSNIESLLLFTCSFGGIFAKIYATGGVDSLMEPRDHVNEAYRNIIKTSKKLKESMLLCSSYDKLDIPPNSIIYCDPPYKGTASYNKVDSFDHDKFWKWCDEKVNEGHLVYVSEYQAPSHWKCILTHLQTTTTAQTKSKQATEKLFVNAKQFENKQAVNNDKYYISKIKNKGLLGIL